MKRSFMLLSIMAVALDACNSTRSAPQIKDKINQLYTAAGQTFYGRPADTGLFSGSLAVEINRVQEVTTADEARIRNSDSPTDKPILLEGSAFSSLYDGYSGYTIKAVYADGNKATAIVDFEYEASPKERWTDTVLLVNEHDWKIDDVRFGHPEAGDKSARERLAGIKLTK